MNEYFSYNKNNMWNKWCMIVVAVCMLVVLSVCLVVLLPKAEAKEAHIYVEGKFVGILHLDEDYNPVATYSGVRVQVADGNVQVVKEGKTITLKGAGTRIVYPTLGVVIELK